MRTPARPTPLALAIALALPVTLPLQALGAPALEDEIVVTAARMQSPLEVVTDPRLPRQPLPAHDGADYLKTVAGFSVIRKGGTDGDPPRPLSWRKRTAGRLRRRD